MDTETTRRVERLERSLRRQRLVNAAVLAVALIAVGGGLARREPPAPKPTQEEIKAILDDVYGKDAQFNVVKARKLVILDEDNNERIVAESSDMFVSLTMFDQQKKSLASLTALSDGDWNFPNLRLTSGDSKPSTSISGAGIHIRSGAGLQGIDLSCYVPEGVSEYTPNLTLMNKDGASDVYLNGGSDGGFVAVSGIGKSSVSLLSNKEVSGLVASDRDGHPRLTMQCTNDGGRFGLTDIKGVERLVLGPTSVLFKTGGDKLSTPESSIIGFGPDGKCLYKLPN